MTIILLLQRPNACQRQSSFLPCFCRSLEVGHLQGNKQTFLTQPPAICLVVHIMKMHKKQMTIAPGVSGRTHTHWNSTTTMVGIIPALCLPAPVSLSDPLQWTANTNSLSTAKNNIYTSISQSVLRRSVLVKSAADRLFRISKLIYCTYMLEEPCFEQLIWQTAYECTTNKQQLYLFTIATRTASWQTLPVQGLRATIVWKNRKQ
jgi:hypothetical protein